MLDSNNNPVSEEEYKEFLKKYIKKKKEFKKFLPDTSDDQKDAMINSIIDEIYQFRSWYVGVYGEYGLGSADSENYSNCQGAIDQTLVGDLKVPVDSKSGSFTFNNNNSYGVKNGEVHNGVDLDSSSAGISSGDSVYSIHDGVVESVGVDENVETAGATDATEETSSEDVTKYCKNACSKNSAAKNNEAALNSCKNSCISACKSKDNIKTCTKDFEAKSIKTDDDSDELGGTWIKIKHTDIVVSKTKYTFYSVYRNLDTNSVTLKQGDTVKKGDTIGKIGTTNSGVSQLHFEFRNDKDQAIDPTNLFVKCTSTSGGTGTYPGDSTQAQIINSLLGAGFNYLQTATVITNMNYESSYDYTVMNSYGCKGLVQWCFGRGENLIDYATSKGKTWQDLPTQLTFLNAELTNQGEAFSYASQRGTEYTLYKETMDIIENYTDVNEAVYYYCMHFEKPGESYCLERKNGKLGESWLSDIQSKTVKKVTAGSGGTVNSSDNSESGGYPNGTFTSSIGNKTYKQFEQWTGDYAEKSYWNGTMHDSGCGPTSIAILVSGLTNPNISPYDVATKMNNDWGFTGPEPMKDIMSKYGLSPRSIDNPSSNDITDALSRGEVMIVHVNKNTQFTNGNSGHYITIVDYNAQGEVYIIDPGSYVDAWFPLSEVMKGCTLMLATPVTGSVQ